jgi:hypothetical protein
MDSNRHDVLVWGPASEGEHTSQGRILPRGWVWTCSCQRSGVGFPSEAAAEEASEDHVT